MDVGFGFDRYVEIDHMADLIDIDSPGCNVRCDEHSDFAIAEPVQNALPGVLRSAPVDSLGGFPCIDQGLKEPIGPMLGAHKHQHAGPGFVR